jgi:gluconokinase
MDPSRAPHDVGPEPRIIVVMGVSGSGKTTFALALGQRLGWPVVEGDQLHPAANVAKMAAGVPLTDEDRWPWLDAVAARIGELETEGRSCVVTCSALRRRYRDRLREGHPSVVFVELTAKPSVLRERIIRRTGHFMPASLLDSQLEALEPLQPDEPGVVLGEAPVQDLVDRVVTELRGEG